MIRLPAEPPELREAWRAMIELARLQPAGWTLIGAQMVALHAFEREREPPRLSLDMDVLVNVRLVAGGTRRVSETLLASGFQFDAMGPNNIGHRFIRGDARIDVLAPDGLGPRTDVRTVPPARTIEVPGGSQALQRSEMVDVELGTEQGTVPRPDLLGAILIKVRAVDRDDVPENQRRDLTFLFSLVEDPRDLAKRMTANERKWLRRRKELLDPNAHAWAGLANAEDARLALRIMVGL